MSLDSGGMDLYLLGRSPSPSLGVYTIPATPLPVLPGIFRAAGCGAVDSGTVVIEALTM